MNGPTDNYVRSAYERFCEDKYLAVRSPENPLIRDEYRSLDDKSAGNIDTSYEKVCEIDNAITKNWYGCKDPKAQYKEPGLFETWQKNDIDGNENETIKGYLVDLQNHECSCHKREHSPYYTDVANSPVIFGSKNDPISNNISELKARAQCWYAPCTGKRYHYIGGDDSGECSASYCNYIALQVKGRGSIENGKININSINSNSQCSRDNMDNLLIDASDIVTNYKDGFNPNTNPDSTNPDSTDPDSTDPDSTNPGSTDPEVTPTTTPNQDKIKQWIKSNKTTVIIIIILVFILFLAFMYYV